ncbi:MAG: hypothetical protein ACK5JF_03840 [Oscillospiraceae bacterium]
MSLTENLYKYFCACPLVDTANKLNFNFLGEKPTEYTIEEVPETPVIQQYVSGSSIRQKTFYFASREEYGQDARVQIEKSGFYEQMQVWVEEQNRKRRYPCMLEGQTAKRIECLSSGYLYTSETDTARYQIQLRLTYFQKGERA